MAEAPVLTPWRAQEGPQLEAIKKHWVSELFFGGAVGGGKSDFLLGDWAQDAPQYGANWHGILFRKSYPQLEELVARSKQMYPKWFGFQAKDCWTSGNHTWTFPNGSTLKFRHAEDDDSWMEYQGHQYCVAVDTPIVMADGTYKPIKDIKTGDLVQTLEGPRAVRRVVQPYTAPCVRAYVVDAHFGLVGEQVHPVWHPVLSSDGLLSEENDGSCSNEQRFRFGSDAQLLADVEFLLYGRREIRGWRAFSADDRNASKESVGECLTSSRPAALSFPVVLHSPTRRSAQQQAGFCGRETMQRRDLCRSGLQWLVSKAKKIGSLWGLSPSAEPKRSSLGCSGLRRERATACVPDGTRKAPGYRDGCRCGRGLCGEPVLPLSENDSGFPRRQVCAAEPSRAQPLGESDKTPTHSHLWTQRWVHPYTGEARGLSEEVEAGQVVLIPCGDRLVCDIEVEGANHYISSCGLVNKNTWLGYDELPHWSSPNFYRQMKTRVRNGAIAVPNKRIRGTGNPGGPGHGWIKQYFGIDKYPLGSVLIPKDREGGNRMFVKSSVKDNRILLDNDPEYIERLQGLGSEALVQMYLEGDWNVVAGAFFPEFNVARHVIQPFEIPKTWTHFRAMDWGSSAPFSVGWYAVSDGSEVNGRFFPRGALIKYREWYGCKEGEANVGLKLTAEEVAIGIKDRERKNEKFDMSVIDPSAFKEDGGPSIASRMGSLKVHFQKADNARKAGWDALRSRLKGDVEGRPMIYFFTNCADTIRTLPMLQHDTGKSAGAIEDVDTHSEDHAGDEVRYACMSRPWVKPGTAAPVRMTPTGQITANTTFNELLNQATQRRKANED